MTLPEWFLVGFCTTSLVLMVVRAFEHQNDKVVRRERPKTHLRLVPDDSEIRDLRRLGAGR